MSRPGTRQGAVAAARKPDSGLTLEPDAAGPGLREWLASVASVPGNAAVFDTRVNMPSLFSGRASRSIGRKLRQSGCELAAKPQSFFVTKRNHLLAGEQVRARAWGARLAATMSCP